MATWRRKKQVLVTEVFTAVTGSPGTPIWVIPLWFVGGLLVDNLSETLGMFWTLAIAAVVLAGYSAWWLWKDRRSRTQKVGVTVKEEAEPSGKRGLILPLSTIALNGGTPEQQASLRSSLRRIAGDDQEPPSSDDFALLGMSNLESPLRAIEFHYQERHGTERLRDCWLITTEDVTYPNGAIEHGSQATALILEKWFLHLHPEAKGAVVFHRDDYRGIRLCVRPRDYASLWLIVDAIFENAPYKPEHIIVDITPGPKPMTLAIALACLGPKRTMQYIAAGRHPVTGEVLPKGRRVPILLDDDAYLYELEPTHN
ncbi:MAG: hypothetical protein GX575_11095 [Candidatus Anammoximicrobium sp.]|mgnify:CR=1 FL=1|nr:hypothetical protein [Candidatus Anammoximicrobium sp.]